MPQLALLCFSLLAADPVQPQPAPLSERLRSLIRAHKGQVAIAIKNLETGETFFHKADTVMPTAGLISLAVMIEAYQQADAGKLKLTDTITLRDADKVPGSGILARHFSEGTTFSLRDAVHIMIACNDDTAAKLVLDRVSVAAVNQRLQDWGFVKTRIDARTGRGSTTARDTLALLEDLQLNSRNRPAIKQALLGHLARNTDKDQFTRLLPEGTRVWHKDGAAGDVRTAAGYLQTPGGIVAVCVLTCENEDRREHAENAGNLLCARVARAVYDHFAGQAKREP